MLHTLLPAGTIAISFDDSEVLHAQHPPWFKDSFLDLEEDLKEAKAAGKKGIMLYFGTTGCAYCQHFMNDSLADPEISKRVQEHFDSIGFEIFDDSEMVAPEGHPIRVKEYASREGAEFSPTVIFLDTSGRRMLRIVGYYSAERFATALDFVIGDFYKEESLKRYAAGAAGRGQAYDGEAAHIDYSLFDSPPHALDRSRMSSDRPLLVVFDQEACTECELFHRNVLGYQQVRELLSNFDIVRLEADDNSTPVITPRGVETTPATWAEQLDLANSPSLVFFDESGRQVLKIDSLVLRQRMMNSLYYVLEKAYLKGMSYQRFARSRALEKLANN